MFFSKTNLDSVKASNLNVLDTKEMLMILGGCGRSKHHCQSRHKHEHKKRGGGCHNIPTPPPAPAPTPTPPPPVDENDVNGF